MSRESEPDMEKQLARPYSRPWQARLMRVVNVPMRLALRLPFKTPLSERLMLLEFTGRKSGKVYQQPVSYVPDGGTLLTPGGGKWKLNLREGQPIDVRLRGQTVRVCPELIRDVDEVERLLRRMSEVNPRVTSFVPVMGSNGEIDREKLMNAVQHGFRIIRWHLPERSNALSSGVASVSHGHVTRPTRNTPRA